MRIRATLVTAAAVLTATPSAQAAYIIGGFSVDGPVRPVGSSSMATATGLDFFSLLSPGNTGLGVPAQITSALGSGTFSGLSCILCGTIKDLPNFSVGPISNFIQLNNGASFDLVSISSVQQSATPAPNLSIFAQGTIRFAGYQNTPARLTLTTQGVGDTTFSSIAISAVPEPASWAMMIAGFGLMGGLLRASRRSVRVRYANA